MYIYISINIYFFLTTPVKSFIVIATINNIKQFYWKNQV